LALIPAAGIASVPTARTVPQLSCLDAEFTMDKCTFGEHLKKESKI